MRSPKVYWRWFRLKEISKGWEPTDTGWVLTIAMIVLVQSLALPQQCDSDGCRSKLDDFLDLKPSEMGDTLAGLFSALAFIWIIVTVFMQSRELREQRKEFREQRMATQDMARTMSAQAKVFEDEQRQRDEGRTETLLNEMLRSLVFAFSESRERGVYWNFSDAAIDEEFGSLGEIHTLAIGDRTDEDLAIDEAIIVLRRRLSRFCHNLWEWKGCSRHYTVPEKSEIVPDLLLSIERITILTGELSPPQRERLGRLRLSEISLALNELLEEPEFWREATQ